MADGEKNKIRKEKKRTHEVVELLFSLDEFDLFIFILFF